MTNRRILAALTACAAITVAGAAYLWAVDRGSGVWAEAIRQRFQENR